MDNTFSLPQDLAGCQRLMIELTAHLRQLDAASAARESQPAHPAVSSTTQGPPQPSPLDELAAQLRDREALVEEQARAILDLQKSRERLQQSNETLQLTLDKLLRQIYGRRSERFVEDPTQKKLDFGDDPQIADAFRDAVAEAQQVLDAVQTRRQAKPQPQSKDRSEKFPDHLPRVEKTVDAPAAQKTCSTHGERKLIGYDITETLKIKRPELYVEVTKYPKYACPGQSDCGVGQAARSPGLVAGNRFDTSVAAEIINLKYAYHLPFYRQQDWYAACGWSPTRSTLLNILAAAEELFQPLAAHYRQILLTSRVIGCDETGVTLIVPRVIPGIDPLDPRSKRIHEVLSAAREKDQPSVQARMWAYRGVDVPLNIFDFTVSRHRDGPDDVLDKYEGTLLGNCWSGFHQIAVRHDGRIARAACWAHARRKVFDGRSSHPQLATLFLALIRQLYDIEDRARELSADDRVALRQRDSLPLLNRIRTLLDSAECSRVLPKSVFAEALGYLRNHWQALLQFTTNGLLPIDNNDGEQLMKQVATGRKNWLFKGSVEAGNRAATLLTLVSSAVRHDLDVGAYLKDALDQLLAGSTDYASLRADVWKLSHPEHVRVYRRDERQDASDRRTKRRAQRRLAQSEKNAPEPDDPQ